MSNNTLNKGILILEALAAEAREFSLGDLAELTGLGKSQACRLLKTLVEQGYVIQNAATRNYQIGLRSLELSASILQRMDVRRAGLTYLHDLTDETKSPSYLGLPYLGKVLTVETVYPAGVYSSISPGFGSTMVLHDSAMGRALLANMKPAQRKKLIPETENLDAALAEIKQTGMSVIFRPKGDNPTVVGVASIVRNYQGQVIGALGASTTKTIWDNLDQDRFKNLVVKAANGLSFALGYAADRLVL